MSTTKSRLAAAASLLTLAATGCGNSTSTRDTSSSAAASDTVSFSAVGGLEISGTGPVSTTVWIDRTSILGGDRALAGRYKTSALQMLAPTIARGGTLELRVFGRVGGHSVPVLAESIPPLSEMGPAGRDDDTMTGYVAAALDAALGLAPASDELSGALEKLTEGPGSDVARAAGEAIVSLAEDPAPTRNVLVLSDGRVQQTEFVLKDALSAGAAEQAGRQIVENANVPQDTRKISLLRIRGLGSTSGQPDGTSEEIEAIDASWEAACDALPAEDCDVSPST